ncbi:L10-interacting MYB domain-containing protein-like [Abeliophyllum distichum]|uniref:L10-interacting MYB domain-containing protein-like n=1 Tax=Abeliophyllum distichum TaxID=126358 RepID=A0ABD1RFL8_9LAMI
MRTEKSTPVKPASPTRKNAKWAERKHQIFLTVCEAVIVESHRMGKCFSKQGWERLVNLINTFAAKRWSRIQHKNHWDSMRREHKHLHELLCITGLEYNQRDNVIVADDDWWEQKIKAFDLDKYAMTPTKLSQRRFEGVINSGNDSPYDTLPIFAETRDSSDEGPIELGSSSRMDISGCHSVEKQKGSTRRSKEKAKK